MISRCRLIIKYFKIWNKMQRNVLFDYIKLKNMTKYKTDDKLGKILATNSYEKQRVNVYYVNITFKLKTTPKCNR